MATMVRSALHVAFIFLAVVITEAQEDQFYPGDCSHNKFIKCDLASECEDNVETASFRCFCREGYTGDGYKSTFIADATGCTPVGGTIECTGPSDCHHEATCTQVDSNSNSLQMRCVCNPGYTGDGAFEDGCTDIDECALDPCPPHSTCANSPGYYNCTCDTENNYIGDAATGCRLVCFDENDCGTNERCVRRQCVCKLGYVQFGAACVDKNECIAGDHLCPAPEMCINTDGSYDCRCPAGLYLEGSQCVPYKRDCTELLASDPGLANGTYMVDFDLDGPGDAVEVDCIVVGSDAYTEVAPLNNLDSPRSVPRRGDTVDVQYPADPAELINNSPFCSQEVRLQCSPRFDGGMIQWVDVQGVTRSGWGGTSDDMCACGDTRHCPNGCNCGFGAEGVDEGVIIDKSRLPLKQVIFPVSSGSAGTYTVGKLRCGPNPYGFPRNCHEAKFDYGIKKDTPLYIDIDGDGPISPFLVFCNQQDYVHVGITEVPVDQTIIHRTSATGDDVTYMPGPDVSEVISGSVFCSQRVEYDCSASTMDEAGFELTLSSGPLSYIPAAPEGQEGYCGCGLTESCVDSTVHCQCDAGGVSGLSDMGLIIDKTDLPVLNVKSTVQNNFFTIGPLQCSERQFGIEPNCEKIRQAGYTRTGSFMIDPDGPQKQRNQENLDPFMVVCEMDANQGITVVNNGNGDGLDLSSGNTFGITYLQASPAQISSLKNRSTSCIQDITFNSCPPEGFDISSVTVNDDDLSALLSEACPNNLCPCDTPLTIYEMSGLPITEISGGSGTASVGALKCSEIFKNCQAYLSFIKNEGALGEARIAQDTLTIDVDGMEEMEPFVVKCLNRETIIKPPSGGRGVVRIPAGRTNGRTECFPMNYYDMNGAGIGAPVMAKMMETSAKCSQSLTLSCENAVATGMVHYKVCGDNTTTFHKFVDADIDATCSCGAAGNCEGGPDVNCNCDVSGDVRTQDVNLIMDNARLPICEVCMELEGIDPEGAGAPSHRFIRFDVSDVRCGRGPGRGNCFIFRQNREYENITEETFAEMWYDPVIGSPFLLGCRFRPDPRYGEMMIRPQDPVYLPGEPGFPGNITIIYRGFEITAITEAVDDANYCTQDIIFFCVDSVPALTGEDGLYSQDVRLAESDYDLRDLEGDELTELCGDERFADQCTQCSGTTPKRLVIINKDRLPLTRIQLPADYTAPVAVRDAFCSYVERDCEAIRAAGKEKSHLLIDGTYVIDPDMFGPIKPFAVYCEFIENQGITKVPTDIAFFNGTAGGDGGNEGADFEFTGTYPTATPEQISSLVQISEFCWQGVKYECEETPLPTILGGPNSQPLASFGTADDPNAQGCACDVLGTCETEGLTCNCQGSGSMVDQGFVTNANSLPVTGFETTFGPGASGRMTVTDVRCGPSPVDIPRDCAEAQSLGRRQGVDWDVSGEVLISPDPENVRPFLVYCDYEMSPNNPVTVIRPTPTENEPVDENTPDVPYQGPSDEQLQALFSVSAYCYQPVKIDCYAASFIESGVTFVGIEAQPSSFWSSAWTRGNNMCTCGSEELCGGLESGDQQLDQKCNCDIGDEVWRSDAAILDIKEMGAFKALQLTASSGQLNLTVGDVFCAPEPIEFNECEMGFNDCDPHAECADEEQGYTCTCPEGWRGRVAVNTVSDPPIANGRQCIDDDECTLANLCEYNSVCVNTPGSYYCDCLPGYRRGANQFECVDIDECAEQTDNCDVNARCKNTDGSFVCRCRMGYRGEGTEGTCYEVGECSCFGDPHCMAFDGRWNHYQGECNYVMAQSDCGGSGSGVPFRVSTDNWDRGVALQGRYAWVKEVTVEIYGTTVVLGQGNSILVNGTERSSYWMLNEAGDTVLLQVAVIGFRVELVTDFGLEVAFDGSDAVTVVVPSSYSDNMCGLCGNYNGGTEDDWTVGPRCPALEGTITDNEVLFGSSWSFIPNGEDPSTCPVPCEPGPPDETCNKPRSQVDQVCDKLFVHSVSPFITSGCLDQMSQTDLDGFQYACTYDLCHTDDLGEALCAIAERLADFCSNLLAEGLEWRSADLCSDDISCEENEEYSVCGPDTEPTCLSQAPVPIVQCRENCYCMEGYLRQGDECLRPEDCGCVYDNSFLAIGAVQMAANCTERVTCADHDDLQTEQDPCGEDQVCVEDQPGVFICTAPVTTPPAPVTTPPAPVTTPPAPVTTPPAPVTTPPAPVTTPPAPVTTPPAPVTTPLAPVSITPAPVTTPPAPVTTPEATFPAPVTTSPVVTTPETTSPEPATTPPAPVTTAPPGVTTNGVTGTAPGTTPVPPPPTPPPAPACTRRRQVKLNSNDDRTVVVPPLRTEPVEQLTSIRFMVKGCSDVTFLLAHTQQAIDSGNNDNLYEIMLRGLDCSTQSEIRTAKGGPAVATDNGVGHPGLYCRGNKYFSFWVSWGQGLIQVGRQTRDSSTGNMVDGPAFMAFQDNRLFPVNFIIVAPADRRPVVWKFDFPCEEQPETTPAPPPTEAPRPAPSPQPCTGDDCGPNMQCVDGLCVCLMGFTADCEHCVDINECEDPALNNCGHLGQECVNTEGSYICTCKEGFVMQDNYCHDVNECQDVNNACGPHAECRNLLGTYECICCMGYSKNGEACQRDPRLDAVYGAPGQECCACTGNDCNDPQPVCGSDGETYANFAAMVVTGCRDQRTIQVNYRGYCQDSCDNTPCVKPFETCSVNAEGQAVCSCPDCSGADSQNSGPRCASDGRVYQSECIFQLIMCVTGRSDVTLQSSLSDCPPDAGPVGPWSEWSDCSNSCGRGTQTRSRQALGPYTSGEPLDLEQEVVCYSVCEDPDQCTAATCTNPGQVCEVSTVTNQPTCVCPDCTGVPDSPVCALVGDRVRTFTSECEMRLEACSHTKNYDLLADRACEEQPPDCHLVEDYAILKDSEDCVSTGDANLGFCYGKCPDGTGECCRPVQLPEGSSGSMASLTYTCPDGSTKTVEKPIITACACDAEPQH